MIPGNHIMIVLCMLLTALSATLLGHSEEDRLRIRTIAVDDWEMPKWHIVSDAGTYVELNWPTGQPTSTILVSKSRELCLFSKTTKNTDEAVFTVTRKLGIPEGMDEVLLVAWPDQGDGKAGIMVVRDGLRKSRYDEWLFINTSSLMVDFQYGSHAETIQLEPLGARTCRINPEQGHGCSVVAKAKVKDDWKTVYSTYWAAPEKQRSIILFSNKDNRVKVRRIIDFLQVED